VLSQSKVRGITRGSRKQRERQEELWYRREMAKDPGFCVDNKLNEVLWRAGVDEFCDECCRGSTHEKLGRPLLPPGMYFRMLIGPFEGIESERCIAWRVADSLCVRSVVARWNVAQERDDAPLSHVTATVRLPRSREPTLSFLMGNSSRVGGRCQRASGPNIWCRTAVSKSHICSLAHQV
jgi:hypothetical protein